jgi:spermidine synthase
VLKYVTLAGLILVIYSSSSGILNKIHGLSVARQFRPAEILEYRNSIYGNIAVTQKERQYTFFYNGIPIITAPYPDTTFVEELGHLPLLFHNAPLDVLIISSGAGGIINEVLKHPVKRIDYAELDPLIIEMLKKYPTALTKTELSDNRVNVINTDGRFFMRNTKDKYDIVLIGLSKPSDLSTNRLFTQEFFALVKKRLNREGILAFWLPGSLTYLSKDLKDINACILNGLKNNYECVRIIPGDYNIFLASGDKNIFKVSASLIAQKINQKNIQTKLLIPDYLNYRLDKRWIVWFQQSMQGSTVKTNHDLMPFAVFKMLIFWNRQFSPRLGAILEYFENLDLKKIALFVLVITILLFYIFNLKKTRAKLSIAYSIATTGFFGMLSSLMLIFGFQVFYGYLYHRIGILMSIFMAGIALGSIWMTSRLGKINRGLRLFMQLEAMIAIFSFILAGIIIKGRINFTMFFFISGLFLGLEFPLAGKIYLGKNGQIGLVSGLLYCADLMGGWVAGILAGMVFLPVLGILNTCVVIAIFKLSSLILLLATKRNIPSDNIQ